MSTALELLDSATAIESASQASFVSLSERPLVAHVKAARAKGVSLEMKTARHGKPIRDAVAVLVEGVVTSPDETMFCDVFSPRWSFTAPGLVEARLTTRIAWNLVGTWLLKHAAADCESRTSLADAEGWFGGNLRVEARPFCKMFSAEAVWQAEQLLNEAVRDEELSQLLPHIFEEHGQGSRASVMRDPSTAAARSAKRRGGVFYTPADVANYMIREALSGDPAVSGARCLDPACGTGVFLLALLRLARATEGPSFDAFEYATRCLHGMDISGQALDACAFLLLRECWSDARQQGFTPWAAWHRLRLNLVQVDALTVAPVSPNVSKVLEFGNVIASLKNGEFVTEESENAARAGEPGGLFGTAVAPLNMVFPGITAGFDCIIGNPPYAAIGKETDLHRLSHEFRSLPEIRASARPNLFPLFVEMMWKFARPDCSSAALVTPLSIAYHTGTQFENCRRAMSAAGGRWRFSFFDREPHALFGEEVKTRNAILFHRRSAHFPPAGELAEIETGPLRKWTSRTRPQLFDSIDFTPVGQSSITFGIPKLRGSSQATAFRMLQRRHERLPSLCARIRKVPPVETLEESLVPRVFVGGTAYNFINVYRSAERPEEAQMFPMSESPVHCLEFRREADAEASLAILSSRIVFWLWHVLGDGFHVSGRLFDAVPFSRGSFSADVFAELATLGRGLWQRLQGNRYTSLNGGRTTIGYRPFQCGIQLDAIDNLLGTAAELQGDFLKELRAFIQSNAIVDEADDSRSQLRQHFSDSTLS